jgi:uncharacterized membrane protein
MAQDRTRKIVVTGILGALSIFLALTPLGFWSWGPVSATILHVPVIIGAVIEGPVVGVIVGLIFGVFSMLRAAIAPNGPLDPAFTNPLISVLPRLFIGPIAWLVWSALKRWPPVGLIAAGIAGSVTNTVLVLGMIGLVPSALGILRDLLKAPNTPAISILSTLALANGLPEAIVSALLVLVVVAAYWRIRIGKRKGASLEG